MLKMLIVDDERMIREGIRDIVDWQEYGIEVVGTAANGIEAMELYKNHLPQIVITDIKMPKMGGLELTRYFNEKKAGVKVVILSGYEEFSFAQEALKLGAEDYLLKPVVPDRLVERILQIKEICELDRRKKAEEEKLLQQIKESIPLLREKFLMELVEGNFTCREDILERAEYLGVRLEAYTGIGVLIVHLDGYKKHSRKFSEMERQLLNRSVENSIKEIVKSTGEVFSIRSGEFCIIKSLDSAPEAEEQVVLQDICQSVQGILQSRCDFGTTIGAGRVYNDIMNISDSFYEAKEAIKYKLVMGKGQVIFIQDIGQNLDNTSRYPEELEKDIVFAVKNGDKSRIHPYIVEYFGTYMEKLEVEYTRWASMKLLYAVSLGVTNSGGKIKEIIGQEAELWECLSGFDTLKEIQEWVEGILVKIVDSIIEKSSNKNKPIIDRILEYLNGHYSENFSLKKLAEEIYLSPNYICSLFKQEMGKNISDYLTDIRIEKAKELLKDHTKKVYEISNMLGFVDSRYFNKVFRKYTGMNLTEYRDKVLE